jgi:phosphate-selective porin
LVKVPVRAGLLLVLGATAAPAGADDWRRGPHVGVSNPDADFRLKLAGYIQGDARSFRNWDAPEGVDDTELRRLRVGLEGKWKRVSFELSLDPRSERNDNPGEGAHHLKDAWVEVKVSKALHVRGGHFKLPFGVEFQTSAAKTDFIESTQLADALNLSRDLGLMAEGSVGKRLEYSAGIFAGDEWREHGRAGTTAAARVVVTPLTGLETGASYTLGSVEADAETLEDPRPKGFRGRGPTGFDYFDRHFVDGHRKRFGLDAVYRRGPVGLKGEMVRAREERKGQGSVFDDLPDEVAMGWALSATWLLTGEKKKKGAIEPKRPLFHGPGAIEAGLRYESFRFDDTGPDGGFAGSGNRARNIRPAGDKVFTGGLSWWPVEWMRVRGNVVLERFEDPLLAPESGRRGSYVTLLGRLQLQLP